MSAAVDWTLRGIRPAPIGCIADRALVRQKSRDFFWYSPVLNERPEARAAPTGRLPGRRGEVVRTLAYCQPIASR
jgi:hypothetical protein